MGKKKKRNNKRVNPPEINKRILNGFLDMESDAGNMMELFGGFWPLIEQKEQDMLNIRDITEVPQLDFSKIISKEQPSGTKIAKYMDGEIKVSKFSVGQVVKLKDYDALKLENDALTYQLNEWDLRRISNAQVTIYKALDTRQLRKDCKPVFWYEVGRWGRNIADVPEDFLEELPEPVNIPDDNEEGEKQPEKPVEETMDEMVEKFEEVLHELVSYDKMAGGDPNLYHLRIKNFFEACFMKKTSNPEKIECLLHITSIARAAYQHYAQVTLSMSEISQEQLYTYRKKNADYGNAFEKSMNEDGLLVAKIRIGDKIRRINSLIKNNGEWQVKDERLEDTYLDLANYCVMTILWIRKQYSK